MRKISSDRTNLFGNTPHDNTDRVAQQSLSKPAGSTKRVFLYSSRYQPSWFNPIKFENVLANVKRLPNLHKHPNQQNRILNSVQALLKNNQTSEIKLTTLEKTQMVDALAAVYIAHTDHSEKVASLLHLFIDDDVLQFAEKRRKSVTDQLRPIYDLRKAVFIGKASGAKQTQTREAIMLLIDQMPARVKNIKYGNLRAAEEVLAADIYALTGFDCPRLQLARNAQHLFEFSENTRNDFEKYKDKPEEFVVVVSPYSPHFNDLGKILVREDKMSKWERSMRLLQKLVTHQDKNRKSEKVTQFMRPLIVELEGEKGAENFDKAFTSYKNAEKIEEKINQGLPLDENEKKVVGHQMEQQRHDELLRICLLLPDRNHKEGENSVMNEEEREILVNALDSGDLEPIRSIKNLKEKIVKTFEGKGGKIGDLSVEEAIETLDEALTTCAILKKLKEKIDSNAKLTDEDKSIAMRSTRAEKLGALFSIYNMAPADLRTKTMEGYCASRLISNLDLFNYGLFNFGIKGSQSNIEKWRHMLVDFGNSLPLGGFKGDPQMGSFVNALKRARTDDPAMPNTIREADLDMRNVAPGATGIGALPKARPIVPLIETYITNRGILSTPEIDAIFSVITRLRAIPDEAIYSVCRQNWHHGTEQFPIPEKHKVYAIENADSMAKILIERRDKLIELQRPEDQIIWEKWYAANPDKVATAENEVRAAVAALTRIYIRPGASRPGADGKLLIPPLARRHSI
ncbi:MAG: hypothetical protein ACXU8A_07570 [Burkholderiaceae bacterium]